MHQQALRIGFSSCPNDTFMFHGLVHGRVAVPNVAFDVVMDDIEALNRRAVAGDDPLPLTKLSVSALGHVLDRYAVLDAGAALGRGCGPLVVQRGGLTSLGDLAGRKVGIPGAGTTAYLLLRLFGPARLEVEAMRFDRIMPAVASGAIDAGLVIHESRFTYRDHGLVLLADLGEAWEARTGLPLPLGVIAADRRLSPDLRREIELGIRESIRVARRDPQASAEYVRAHAQELHEDVCRNHIALYVNAFSDGLGAQGRAAIERLLEEGRRLGLMPAGERLVW